MQQAMHGEVALLHFVCAVGHRRLPTNSFIALRRSQKGIRDSIPGDARKNRQGPATQGVSTVPCDEVERFCQSLIQHRLRRGDLPLALQKVTEGRRPVVVAGHLEDHPQSQGQSVQPPCDLDAGVALLR
eukprot:scaffold7815_cov248-Pinguiococcus_pyrenoidosus.AAC.4